MELTPVLDGHLLDLLYSAAGDPEAEGWSLFLQEVAGRMRATWTGFLSIDSAAREHSLNFNFGIPEEATRLYEEYYGALDPWFLGYKNKKMRGWAGSGAELCPPREVEKTEFCNEYFRPYDLFHECGTIIERPTAKLSVLTSLRRRQEPDFGPEDVNFIRALVPHLKRALPLHEKIMELKHAATAAAEVVDKLDVALIGLNGEGKVCFTTSRAESILRSGTILALRDGRIVTRNPASAADWNRAWKSAASPRLDTDSPPGSVTLHDGEHCLHVIMFPFRQSRPLVADSMKVMIVITDPAAQPRSREDLLMSLFGLTPAEARVAMLLASGLDPKEISEKTETTQNTVRFQLKVIYRKTGVNRQSQLVRLLSTLPGTSVAVSVTSS
jgi:DNA-binding CsgD family transcriptional regulator